MRIVIVDDHASFRASARALLEAEGFDVVAEAGDAASALATIAALRPDGVLLDVQLPDLDGFEVARRVLSADDGAPAIVMTSSRDVTEFGSLVADCGARGFIPKADLSGETFAALVA